MARAFSSCRNLSCTSEPASLAAVAVLRFAEWCRHSAARISARGVNGPLPLTPRAEIRAALCLHHSANRSTATAARLAGSLVHDKFLQLENARAIFDRLAQRRHD